MTFPITETWLVFYRGHLEGYRYIRREQAERYAAEDADRDTKRLTRPLRFPTATRLLRELGL